MSRVALPIFLFVLLAAQPVQAQEEMTTMIFVKDYIDETEPVELVISVYDQPQGGMLLYQVTKSVTPEDGIFDDSIKVPSEILSRHPQVFVEFAKASSPSDPLSGERMQFAQRGVSSRDTQERADPPSQSADLISVCFTCGGQFPLEAGAINAGTGSHNHQRGPGCSGGLRDMVDRRPRICEIR
jgi:hypothetical protein